MVRQNNIRFLGVAVVSVCARVDGGTVPNRAIYEGKEWDTGRACASLHNRDTEVL